MFPFKSPTTKSAAIFTPACSGCSYRRRRVCRSDVGEGNHRLGRRNGLRRPDAQENLTIALAVVIGAALASLQALTQQQAPPALTIEKTKDDLYTIIGDGGNVAV